MKSKEINQAIALKLGWRLEMGHACHPDLPVCGLMWPDYTASLDTCREMEKFLGEDLDNWMKYDRLLAEITPGFTWHATAPEKCEAFLRVFDLYKD